MKRQQTPFAGKAAKLRLPKHLEHLHANAAGIDIGSRSHFVAVPEGRDPQPVREFTSFTGDLYRSILGTLPIFLLPSPPTLR